VNLGKVIFLRISGVRCQVSGVSDVAGREAAGLIEEETYWEPEKSFRMLWERFPTAINSVGPTHVIVVKNHSHQPLTSTYDENKFGIWKLLFDFF
jgi:K+-transporting ATPase A subunit